MPSVKELEAFIAVVEAGSFQGAARRLNATPPAVSKRISELESELGVRLFERSTRSCRITSRGRVLVPFAQRVLGEIGEIRRTIGERTSLSGHVRLGVVETIAYTQLPEVLRKVSADLPQLTVDVEVGVTTDLVRKVRTREMDIACVVGPVLEPDLVSEPFWEVPLSWISRGSKWTQKPLTLEALAQQTILLPTGGRHISTIEGWFKSRGLRADQIITCNSLTTAVKMTAIGMGMSLVPIECARYELESGMVTLVPVKVQLPSNSFVTTYPVGQVEAALDAVIDVMRELAASLVIRRKPRTAPRAVTAGSSMARFRKSVGSRFAVASGCRYATEAAAGVLAQGGNVIDAALAGSAVLCVTLPHSVSIGGDLFALVKTRGAPGVVALNSTGAAPRRADIAQYRARGHSFVPLRGPLSIQPPGLVAGWQALSERWTSWPLAKLLEPATALARDGFAVGARLARLSKELATLCSGQQGWADTYLVGGAPDPGRRHAKAGASRPGPVRESPATARKASIAE